MKKNVLRLGLLMAMMAGAGSVWGQTIAAWDFSTLSGGTNNFGPSPNAATSANSNVTVGGLTRGSGIGTSGSGAANAWGGNDFTGTSLANAISLEEFVTFTIKPNVDYSFSLSQIGAYNIRRSSTGPTTGQWQYSTDGTNFTDIGSNITWGGTTTSAGNAQSAIDLSGISALQNVPHTTTITFRIVTWGASGTGGTWYLNDPLDSSPSDFTVVASSILPIELLSFSGKPLATSIRLDWATASEQNNDYMAVEKSAEGLRWEELGRVAGAGTTTQPQSYSFTDTNPLPGLNYYRLRQVDYDGRFEYHKTIAVDFKGGPAGGLHLFPSPAKEQLNVALPSAATQDCELWLLDAQGRVLQRQTVAQGGTQAVFEVAALPEGVYFVRMAMGDARSFRFVR